jgi:carbon-monoxide dehydrogenase medium subunit
MEDFEYYAPRSLKEALSLMNEGKGKTKLLAGGTDLIVQMKDRRASPAVLVDVKRIPALNRLEMSAEGTLHIGAAVPLCKIISFAPVRQKFTLLHQACSSIGSIQVRNRATMGGNICNASPSADSAPPLLCLGAKTVVASSHGTREISLDSFFRGPGQTILSDNEILVEIEIPTPPSTSTSCYLRHTPRQEMDLAVVGVAVLLVYSKQRNRCSDAKICLGAVAPTPIRVTDVEDFLAGKTIDNAVIEKASEIAASAASPISDVRASADYRREMVKVLVRRALNKII